MVERKYRPETLDGHRWVLRVSDIAQVDTSQSRVVIIHTTYNDVLMYKDTDRELQQLIQAWREWIEDGKSKREEYYKYRDQTGGKHP